MQQTEYERWIADTEALLDSLFTNYELILNERLDNIDSLIEQTIAEINADAGIIGETITTAATDVGVTLSESMSTIWSENTAGINNVITMYGERFSSAQTSVKTAIDTIQASMRTMISQLSSIAAQKVAEAKTSSVVTQTHPVNNNNNNKNDTPKEEPKKNNTGTGDGTPQKGDRVKFVSGKYYNDSYGSSPLGSKYQGQYVYITGINTKGSHPYHISLTNSIGGNSDLGWLKLNQISGYASGKKNFLDDEIAWTQENGREFIVRPSDGAILTPVAKGDSVLTAAASNNIWSMANNPADFIKNNLGVNGVSAPNNSTVQSNYNQTIENVVFRMDNVKNYDEMLSAMQRDKNFQRLITSMSIDVLAGKSTLAKGKAIR